MQIDLASHIERLLFLHDTLVIPGFGGFTASRSPAAADYVGGAVTPPSKTLTFNENLTVDDGVLLNDIAQAHALSLDEARRAVQDFVDRTQALLNQREIVNLPGVGRLYKNYVQKIQFLPDATNFSADAYGLPPLQFSPIARSREVTEAPIEQAQPAVETAPANPSVPPPYAPPEYETTSPRRRSPAIAALLGILLLMGSAAGAYWWLQQKEAETEPETHQIVEENTPPANENVAPPVAQTPVEPVPEPAADTPTEVDDEKAAQESARLRMENAREQAAAESSGRRCILIVATLQDTDNVQKLVAKFKANKLTPYQFRTSKGYQTGIEFRYTKAREIQDYKAILQQLTGVDDIWVKQQ